MIPVVEWMSGWFEGWLGQRVSGLYIGGKQAKCDSRFNGVVIEINSVLYVYLNIAGGATGTRCKRLTVSRVCGGMAASANHAGTMQ